jgi:hypothetical protein
MTFCAMKVLIVSDLTEWNEDTPRDVSRYILPSENTSLLFPRIYPDNDNKQLDFLLVVTSDPRHFDRRVAIRQTWGAVKNWEPQVKMSIIFLMGLSLQPQVCLFSRDLLGPMPVSVNLRVESVHFKSHFIDSSSPNILWLRVCGNITSGIQHY